MHVYAIVIGLLIIVSYFDGLNYSSISEFFDLAQIVRICRVNTIPGYIQRCTTTHLSQAAVIHNIQTTHQASQIGCWDELSARVRRTQADFRG